MKTQIINPDNIPSIEEMSQFLTNLEDISYHESIVSKALKISKAIPEVEAVFLFGSLSMGNADIFSDIDFYLLHEDKIDYKDIMDSFLAEVNTLGDIIHIFQSNAKKNSIIIYLKPFIKFELVVESYSTLCTEWRLAKRARLIYDKIGLGEKAIKESKREEFSLEPHLDEIRNLALDLPSFCFLISGYMMRGEYITIIDFVAWIRRKLLRISGFMLGLWEEGTRRAEQRFPTELIRYFERCKVKDIDDVWDCLLVFLEWYSDWLVPKFEEHNIIHANQEVSIIKSAIVKLRESFHDKT